MDTEELAKTAGWPYRVVIKMDGDPMGDPHGIPCRTQEQVESTANKYRNRSPRITVEIIDA